MNGNTTALLDILRDDPETAIALAARHGKLDQLFQAYVAEVQADRMEPNWRQFVYMVSSMPRSDWAQAYGRLVELALATNHRGMLLLALVENKRESRSVLACQDTFTPLFVQMTRAEVELVESWPHAVNTYYRHHISRFIERDDLKRAFDTVVEAIRAFCKSLGPVENDLHFVALDPKDPGTRNAVFAQRLRKHADNATLNAYIEMVWRAHRTAELVPDVSDDLMAWENTAKHVTYQYGQNCRGSKPLILEQTDALPITWLWGAYADIGPIQSWECPVGRARLGSDGWGRNRRWFPVRAPGNKLRLLIRYYVSIEKNKKLEAFRQKHGLKLHK